MTLFAIEKDGAGSARSSQLPCKQGRERGLLHPQAVRQEDIEMRERYRLLVEGSDDLMSEIDSEGRFIYVNSACAAILGYEASELAGTGAQRLIHPDDIDNFMQALGSLGSGTGTSRGIYRCRHRNGELRWLDVTITSFQDAEGESRLISIARDISKKIQSEEGLKKALAEKDLAMKELQHRVKNSLAIVSSLLSLKKGSLRDKPSIEIFRSTQARIRSIAGLYEELYRSSENDRVDFRLYVEHLAGSIMETYGGDSKNIEIASTLEEIHLDPKRAISLGLIVNELITNSIKYAYQGRCSGQIGIELTKLGNFVILSVSDHGVGLPEAFDALNSTGLGLTLVRAFAQQLGGCAEFAQADGRGTKVSISFKL